MKYMFMIKNYNFKYNLLVHQHNITYNIPNSFEFFLMEKYYLISNNKIIKCIYIK